MVPRLQDSQSHIHSVVRSVLQAVNPQRLMREALARHPCRSKHPAVIAVGKAAASMYAGWCEIASETPDSMMIVPNEVAAPSWALRGEHPIPAARNVEAARAIEAFIVDRKTSANVDGFVILLSGGASALLTSPAEGLTLFDIAELTSELLRAGAPIAELNRVRKHLERLKGGRMAVLMTGYPVDAYLLSDVAKDDLSTLGSGPVVPDGSTFAGALGVLRAFDVLAPKIVGYLEAGAAGQHSETPKHGDPAFELVRCALIGSNAEAVQTTIETLFRLGYEHPPIFSELVGEATTGGRLLSSLARGHHSLSPAAIVWGGETTVRVGLAAGKGGRNQEFALSAALGIDGVRNIVIASFATDGVDGPTDAAGAIVTGETCRQAQSIGLDPTAFLARHDSHTFFDTLDKAGFPHLIRTGPTGTNVNDVAIALVF